METIVGGVMAAAIDNQQRDLFKDALVKQLSKNLDAYVKSEMMKHLDLAAQVGQLVDKDVKEAIINAVEFKVKTNPYRMEAAFDTALDHWFPGAIPTDVKQKIQEIVDDTIKKWFKLHICDDALRGWLK